MAEDVKDIQRRLKEMELRAKIEAKSEKRKMKEEKMKMKLRKKQEKMQRKLMKRGRLTPEDLKRMEGGAEEKDALESPDKIVKAEVVEFKPKEWERKSVESIEDVEKKIDRFSGKGVSSLSDRYRERYGEDLKVPELYEIETSIEMKDEYDRLTTKEQALALERELAEPAVPKEGLEFHEVTKEKEEALEDEPKPDIPLNFWDLSSGVLFFRKKFGVRGGGGKKAGLIIVDAIILIVAFPITIIRLFTTIYHSSKRRKARKQLKQSQDKVQFAEA